MGFLTLVAIALAVCGDGRFVPPTHREGDRVVMPLTFPDGTRAEFAYPPELRLAELGLVPSGSATVRGDRPHPARSGTVGRDFAIRHGGRAEPRRHSLLLGFGRWTVEVWDFGPGNPGAMTSQERRDFENRLQGRVTRDGFLVLDARPPLRLAEAGEHAGPALEFGSPGAPPWLRLALVRCGPKAESTSPRFASWCLSDSIVVHAGGDRRFIAAVAEGIELR